MQTKSVRDQIFAMKQERHRTLTAFRRMLNRYDLNGGQLPQELQNEQKEIALEIMRMIREPGWYPGVKEAAES